jgi:mannose/cellobiose epimerase-like protein (N-acyl-D-glucosamine 2-epimerase family)
MRDNDINESLISSADRTARWLCDVAAPLWSQTGRTASGLFPERITLSGIAESDYYRVFVQARHIFAFRAIGQIGWSGPWRELIGETMTTLIGAAKRSDGFYVHTLNSSAGPLDRRVDLYDQAFVLLALATAGEALGDAKWFDLAEELLDNINSKWLHPKGGFTEGEIANPSVRRQNPHMHLFEATLALSEASGRLCFVNVADAIAELAVQRLIDPSTGALLEYFTDDLLPAFGVDGRIVEPGHCFEWAWLFERLAAAGKLAAIPVADRLTTFARTYGIDRSRNVAINEVLTDGTVHNGDARLWPQTERLKAACARYRRTGQAAEANEVDAAVRGLEQYYASDVSPGLWRDKLLLDGRWIDEQAPGSSLYHIACAYAELHASVPPI